jgi:predicted metal-dependent hydrolase
MIMPPDDPAFSRGLDLFNRAHFFDAHEVLEDVWRALPSDSPAQRLLRLQTQGIVQLAVAFHHQSKSNYVGARSVLERALRNLEGAEHSFPDLDFERLRAELTLWRRFYLDHFERLSERKGNTQDNPGDLAPSLPKITRRR